MPPPSTLIAVNAQAAPCAVTCRVRDAGPALDLVLGPWDVRVINVTKSFAQPLPRRAAPPPPPPRGIVLEVPRMVDSRRDGRFWFPNTLTAMKNGVRTLWSKTVCLATWTRGVGP